MAEHRKGGFKSREFEKYRDNIVRQRNDLLLSAYQSDEQKIRILQKCKEDVVFFVNYFIYTYNPREENPYLPMVLFPRQKEMLLFFDEAYKNGKWCIVNKSRYTGASVISIAFILHKFLFEEGFSGSLSSNKADSVDKIGDPDCLFSKLIQMYEMLPSWFKVFPAENYRKIKLFNNPYNGSTVKGYSGRDIGRGGRSSLAFIDEIAHLDYGVGAIAAMSENTDCLIGVSTPKGKDNEHYRLFTNEEVSAFTFSWRDDPRRDEDWARKQKIKLGEEIFEQELNCSFDAFQSSAFIPKRFADAFLEELENIPTSYSGAYEEAPVYAGIDIALGGDDTILLILQENIVRQTYKLDSNIDNAIEQMLAITKQNKVRAIGYDQCGMGQLFSSLATKIANGMMPFEPIPYNAAGHDHRFLPNHKCNSKDRDYNNRALYYDILYFLGNNTYQYANGYISEQDVLNGSSILTIPEYVDGRDRLREDLLKAGFEYRMGKLLIESKKDMKKRGLTSTDYSDALICALFAQYKSTF